MAQRIRIGIDTGGTFTDVVAVDEDTGASVSTKTPSTPSNPADGFLDGIEKVLGLLGAGGDAITAVSHGTTVATNQLLEGKVDRLGFVTTAGYEAMLEIARQSVPDGYGNSYFWVKPDRIVPRDLVRGVEGRLDFTGAEVRPFDEAGARDTARWFRDRGITTLGVCFLHAYTNAEHEERMRDILTEEHPDAIVSISSEVLREYREYERAMTTLVDAAVKPRLSAYVSNITARLTSQYDRRDDRRIPFYVMKSNGGVLSADEVVHQPITTVLSGPAAGALGAAMIAKVAGFDKVLTSDGGGTSTDVSVVIDGEPTLTTEGSVGAYPSKIPMIDVVTVGAGGGSIAHVSPEGTLKVGPQSAGADPGPLCYGKGGADGAVTITDAHLVLGRIPPHLLGGEIPLDAGAAQAGLETLAGQLGLSVEAAAIGVLEISAWNQANALRQVTVKRGLDVRDFALTTFGGSGSLLLCRLMDVLGIPTVLVPPDPGNVSAFGLLTVDVKNDYVQTHVTLADRLDPADVAGRYDDLEGRAAAALRTEGFADDQHGFARTADLRYFGQAFEVRVPVPEGRFDAGTATAVADRFHAEHRALYGYDFAADPAQQVEWVNLRVSGIGPIQRPEIRRHERPGGFETGASAPSSTTGTGFETGAGAPSSTSGTGFGTGAGAPSSTTGSGFETGASAPPSTTGGGFETGASAPSSTTGTGFETGASAPPSTTGGGFETGASAPSSTTGGGSVVEEVAQQPSRNHVTRPVCFDADDGYVPTVIVQRSELPPGASLTGPAIIEEYGSTVPVHPGFEVRVDDYLNLIVTRQEPVR